MMQPAKVPQQTSRTSNQTQSLNTAAFRSGRGKADSELVETLAKIGIAAVAILAIYGFRSAQPNKTIKDPEEPAPHSLKVEPDNSPKQHHARLDYVQDPRGLDATYVSNLSVTFPKGRYQVTIVDLKLSDEEGLDSLKSSSKIYYQTFTVAEDGTVMPLNVKPFEASRSILTINGTNGFNEQVSQFYVLVSDAPRTVLSP